MGDHGGARKGSGRWSKRELEALANGAGDEDVAAMRGRTVDAVQRKRQALLHPGRTAVRALATTKAPKAPAEAAARPVTAQAMLEAIARSHADAAKRRVATSQELNPFQLPAFPPGAVPKDAKLRLAMDENTSWGNQQWAGAVLNGVSAQGLLFMGYPFLAELTQRPEYRVIGETIADDATRKFIDFEVTGEEDENADGNKKPGGATKARDPETGAPLERDDPDERKKKIKARGKTDKVKALKDELARLEARDRFYAMARDDGFFGRSHIYVDLGIPLDGGNNPELRTPIGDGRDAISRAKVGRNSLKRLQPVEAMFSYPMAYNASQPMAADFYDPEYWYVMASEVHKSRLPVFVGHPVPNILKPSYAFGGLSLTQMAMPYVNIWLQTRESVGALIHSFSVMVLMTDMQSLLQPSAGAPDLMTRVNLFNAYRDNQGAFVLNKATEDFKNVSASLAGLHELQAQAQEHMASVSRIPLVKLTGISPSGLNASSEGEIRAYYDTIAAYQNRFFRPHLTRIINFMQLSLWGEIDPEITFEFEPLWELSQKEKSEKEKDDADRDSKYVDMGAFSPGEIRKIKIDDPTLPYTGLDPDDVPDLEQEEEQGLEPEGGRPQPIIGQQQGEGEPPEGGKTEDEHPAAPRAKTGLAWGDHYDWMRGYQLPARRLNGDAVVRTPLGGSDAATKGLRVGSRVAYRRGDGEAGQGRIFGFAAGADGAVSVGVLDTDNDRALFLDERSVSARPVLSQDERGRGGDDDADVIPFWATWRRPRHLAGDAEFKEGEHPRAPDGRFGTKAGEQSSEAPAESPSANPTKGGPEAAPAEPTAAKRAPVFQTKKDHAAHLLKKGVTTAEMLQALGWPSISMPAMAKSLNMRLEKTKEGRITKYVGVPLGPAGQPDKTHSLLSLIASRGGIRNDDGNIGDVRSSIGSGNKFMPGYGQLIRNPKQMSTASIMGGKHAPMKIDAAREMAADMGYIPENTTLPEFLDYLDREFRGERIYPIGYVPPGRPDDPAELERAQDDFVSDLDNAVKEGGGADLSDKERARALELWRHEGLNDPSEIIERLALEADDDEAAKGGPERSDPVDGWDVPDEF